MFSFVKDHERHTLKSFLVKNGFFLIAKRVLIPHQYSLQVAITKHSSQFSGFAQQDSQECLSAILEVSHNDMKTKACPNKVQYCVCAFP